MKIIYFGNVHLVGLIRRCLNQIGDNATNDFILEEPIL